ncbi:uncharacterized protein LOC127279676 [Leptopilina boulardi]|uniref:uncharacterized protein LOC127279676 n=1 Tax=Leptopilina boulardi TaxID=63433 RepID=UPI0021F6903D|nr:uncharacterized protein LOC127279676 [Leptopilina boulardi]
MTPGAALMVLLLMMTCSAMTNPSSRATLIRKVSSVKLRSGYMEIVKEETCSDTLIRLYCRSLRSIIFILEAEYLPNKSNACGYDIEAVERERQKKLRQLEEQNRFYNVKLARYMRELYMAEEEKKSPIVDFRSSLNRRCSGLQHCRYKMSSDHPGPPIWNPANIRVKYACIPEVEIKKYCNLHVKVIEGEEGYIKNPGYPLYYLGENSCGWIFRSLPGQRIELTIHDLHLRAHALDGSCVDVIRIRDSGKTIYENCGTAAGITVISNTNLVTVDLVASKNLYPARGFLLQYKVLGCPEVSAPNGSFVSNGTLETRTFQCRMGTIFPDSKQRTKTIVCKNGRWDKSVQTLTGCIATSALILKTEAEENHLSSLSGDNLGSEVRRGYENAVADFSTPVMDSAQNMLKEPDYIVDFILPTVLIALLFVGNAVIVYVIFQYRKRKAPSEGHVEEVALDAANGVPPV